RPRRLPETARAETPWFRLASRLWCWRCECEGCGRCRRRPADRRRDPTGSGAAGRRRTLAARSATSCSPSRAAPRRETSRGRTSSSYAGRESPAAAGSSDPCGRPFEELGLQEREQPVPYGVGRDDLTILRIERDAG